MGVSLRAADAALLLLVAAACAHIEPPPGGPEDKQGPQLLATRPDTMARRAGAFGEPVVLVFDERLSEQSVRDAVSVSPRTSTAEVDHRGDEILVSLLRGC